MNKRGLSTVITTLIIILLVLVAIAIVWIVIRNVITTGTEGIGLGKFTTDLEIKNVLIEESNINVSVKRNPGKGNLSGIKFIFYEGDNSEVIEKNISLKELEEKRFVFLSSELGSLNISNIDKVSIVGIFKSESGKESVGNVADSYEVGDGGEAEQTCAELGGTCCSSSEICQGGSFQSSSDCGILCCVGGSCVEGCVPNTCSGLGYECGTHANGTCSGSLDCGSCGLHASCPSGTCVCDSGWDDCDNDNSCECDLSSNSCVGGNCVASSGNPYLVSWWKFEDNANDEVGNNHGTLNGNPVWVDGIVGKALEFDGDGDYVNTGFDLNNAASYTIQAWIKIQGTNTQYIVSDWKTTQSTGGFIISTRDNSLSFGVSDDGGGIHEGESIIHPAIISNDVWHHVVGVFDANNNEIRIYVNGDKALLSYPNTPYETSSPIYISDDGSFFNGTIDEVKIWNKSLSDAEVTELYESTSSLGLVSWWKFEDNALDSVGSNDGTVSGATYNSIGGYDGNGAYEFDGVDDYIDTATILKDGDSFTISAWVKKKGSWSSTELVVSQYRYYSGTNQTGFMLGRYWGNIFRVYAEENSTGSLRGCKISSSGPSADEWHLMTGTFTKGTIKYYLDGVETGTLSGDCDCDFTADSSYRLQIGRRPHSNEWYFNGTIDEVRIYNRSLSAEEVNALYAL